ncbi:hypothetical protein, partial [Sporolactobacillus inulinus]
KDRALFARSFLKRRALRECEKAWTTEQPQRIAVIPVSRAAGAYASHIRVLETGQPMLGFVVHKKSS